MLGYNDRLRELEEQGCPVRVAVVGAGQMGRGLVAQVAGMRGIRVVAVADVVPGRAVEAHRAAGVPEGSIRQPARVSEAAGWVEEGGVLALSSADIALDIPHVDVVVEATGHPEAGARIALEAITRKKHVVMLNAEADATVGRMLYRLARMAGVVYTGAAGDEPAVCYELFEFADGLGFEVVAAGKGKNNPLDVQATPDTVADRARRQGMNPRMLASFVDGSKTMIEMTILANATGLVPDRPGMHGPAGGLDDLVRLFRPQAEGGILSRTGVVDYVRGVAPGVFVVVRTDQPEVRREMTYLGMGEGPYFLLYRPFHLCSLETPVSIARAALDGRPTIVQRFHRAETVAVAKQPLKAGQRLDGIGGFTVYGRIMPAEQARELGALPLGLAGQGTTVVRDVPAETVLTLDDVQMDEASTLVSLWRLQQSMDETGRRPSAAAAS
ncbi:MAG: NAD(P)-dependent oxidoreductase [Firmicutes bacterium]|nr:NAD(P)-dependent oxidoreductase [Bacillota bacterium]